MCTSFSERGSASAWEREKEKLCRFLLPLATSHDGNVEQCRVDHDHVTDSFGREQLWTQKHQAQLKGVSTAWETEPTSEHCHALEPLFKCSERRRRSAESSGKKLFLTAWIKKGLVSIKKQTLSVEEERRTNPSGHAGVFGVIWRQTFCKQIRTSRRFFSPIASSVRFF